MKNLKSDINCILDLYETEIKVLKEESKYLLDRIEEAKLSIDYEKFFQELMDLESRKSIINGCKDDCIKDL